MVRPGLVPAASLTRAVSVVEDDVWRTVAGLLAPGAAESNRRHCFDVCVLGGNQKYPISRGENEFASSMSLVTIPFGRKPTNELELTLTT